MIKKKKYSENPKFIKLQQNIISLQNTVYNANYSKSLNKELYKTKSCFNINIFNDKHTKKIPVINKNFLPKTDSIKSLIISKKIHLLLNSNQKHVLKIWFKSNDQMYNETIKYLKDNYKDMKNEFLENSTIKEYILLCKEKKELYSKIQINIKNINQNFNIDTIKKNIILCFRMDTINKLCILKKTIIDNFLKKKPYFISSNKFKINYQNIRTYILKDIRTIIMNNCKSQIINENIKIKTHILDSTIKLACTNYQSAITNFENGNIKHFRIRYWKDKRDKRMIEIEQCYFSNGSLCPSISIFRNLKGFYKEGKKKIKFNFNTINSTCKLQYNKKIKSYFLFLSKEIECKSKLNKKNIIGIDLGLRTFATCLSENQIIDICETEKTKLNNLIDKKIKIKNLIFKKNNIKNRKLLLKINKRIKGFIEELQWKTIKFLTDNYKHILIGDLSTKGIVCNNTSVLSKRNKELAYAFSFYEFRQRLEYKCKVKKCVYIKVDEYYTSKTCSVCSNCNENLGSSKIFNCKFCNSVFDRDVNSCRNMIIKCL